MKNSALPGNRRVISGYTTGGDVPDLRFYVRGNEEGFETKAERGYSGREVSGEW